MGVTRKVSHFWCPDIILALSLPPQKQHYPRLFGGLPSKPSTVTHPGDHNCHFLRDAFPDSPTPFRTLEISSHTSFMLSAFLPNMKQLLSKEPSDYLVNVSLDHRTAIIRTTSVFPTICARCWAHGRSRKES